jgi:Sulfotransferase domain
MSELVLHIGTHKTGTTALQEALAAARHRLKAQGLVYPHLHPRESGHHRLVTPWIDLAHRRYTGPPAVGLWRRLAERRAGGRDTVVLSSEEFSRARPQSVDFAELAGFVAGFDRRRVVCYLRNQADYIQSVYLQVLKRGRIIGFDRFVAACIAERFAGGMFLDYGALYAQVRAGFAAEEICFLSYEEAARHPGGIACHFLATIGSATALPAVRRSNVSPSPLAFWVAMRVTAKRRQPGPPEPAMVVAAERAIAELVGPGVRTTLYTRTELGRLSEVFEPLNRRAEAVVTDTSVPLRIAPVALVGPVVTRDELDVQRLMALLAGLPAA